MAADSVVTESMNAVDDIVDVIDPADETNASLKSPPRKKDRTMSTTLGKVRKPSTTLDELAAKAARVNTAADQTKVDANDDADQDNATKPYKIVNEYIANA